MLLCLYFSALMLAGCATAPSGFEAAKMTPATFAAKANLQSITFTEKDISSKAFKNIPKENLTTARGVSLALVSEILNRQANGVAVTGMRNFGALDAASLVDPSLFTDNIPVVPLLGWLVLEHTGNSYYKAAYIGSLNFYYPPTKKDPNPDAAKLLSDGIRIMQLTHEGTRTGPLSFDGYIYTAKGKVPYSFDPAKHAMSNPYGVNFDVGKSVGMSGLYGFANYYAAGVFFYGSSAPVTVVTGVTPGMKPYTMQQIQEMYRGHSFLDGWWAVFNTRLSNGNAVWVVYDGSKILAEVPANQRFTR